MPDKEPSDSALSPFPPWCCGVAWCIGGCRCIGRVVQWRLLRDHLHIPLRHCLPAWGTNSAPVIYPLHLHLQEHLVDIHRATDELKMGWYATRYGRLIGVRYPLRPTDWSTVHYPLPVRLYSFLTSAVSVPPTPSDRGTSGHAVSRQTNHTSPVSGLMSTHFCSRIRKNSSTSIVPPLWAFEKIVFFRFKFQ